MATYYGYTAPDVDKNLDITKATGDIAKALVGEGQAREEQKAELDRQAQEVNKELQNAPLGQSVKRNEVILNGADELKKRMLNLTRQLKAGIIDPREFTVRRQNIYDGWGALKQGEEKWNKYYDQMMTLNSEGKLSQAGLEHLAAIEGMFNYKNAVLTYDDDDNLVVAQIGKDGKPDLSQTASISSLANFNSQVVMKADTLKLANDFASQAAIWEEVGAGLITSIETARQNPAYASALDGYLDNIANDDYTAVSILTDALGYTTDPNASGKKVAKRFDANGGIIYDITPAQKKAVKDYMRDQIEAQVAREINVRQPRTPARGTTLKDPSLSPLFEPMETIFSSTDPAEASQAFDQLMPAMDAALKGSGQFIVPRSFNTATDAITFQIGKKVSGEDVERRTVTIPKENINDFVEQLTSSTYLFDWDTYERDMGAYTPTPGLTPGAIEVLEEEDVPKKYWTKIGRLFRTGNWNAPKGSDDDPLDIN